MPNPDAGAIAYLRSAGFSDERIERLANERAGLEEFGIGIESIVHPIARVAIRLLAGNATTAELWRLASKQSDLQRTARDAREQIHAEPRARIQWLGDLYHASEPHLTRAAMVARIQSGTIPAVALLLTSCLTRLAGGQIDPIRFNKSIELLQREASRLARQARKLNRRTIEKWLQEDCPEITAPRGRPRKKRSDP